MGQGQGQMALRISWWASKGKSWELLLITWTWQPSQVGQPKGQVKLTWYTLDMSLYYPSCPRRQQLSGEGDLYSQKLCFVGVLLYFKTLFLVRLWGKCVRNLFSLFPSPFFSTLHFSPSIAFPAACLPLFVLPPFLNHTLPSFHMPHDFFFFFFWASTFQVLFGIGDTNDEDRSSVSP